MSLFQEDAFQPGLGQEDLIVGVAFQADAFQFGAFQSEYQEEEVIVSLKPTGGGGYTYWGKSPTENENIDYVIRDDDEILQLVAMAAHLIH